MLRKSARRWGQGEGEGLLTLLVIGGLVWWFFIREQPKPPPPPVVTIPTENPSVTAARSRINGEVHRGFHITYDGGILRDDMIIRNNSAHDLCEVEITLTAKKTDGRVETRNNFLGTWNGRGGLWQWGLPAERYQQVRITGRARLKTPTEGVDRVEINTYWNF